MKFTVKRKVEKFSESFCPVPIWCFVPNQILTTSRPSLWLVCTHMAQLNLTHLPLVHVITSKCNMCFHLIRNQIIFSQNQNNTDNTPVVGFIECMWSYITCTFHGCAESLLFQRVCCAFAQYQVPRIRISFIHQLREHIQGILCQQLLSL